MKSSKYTFKRWFEHCCAFNMLASQAGVWKFRYLFHDLDKPFMSLLFSENKVRKIHRDWFNHHCECRFNCPQTVDWEAVAVDWECSRYSKSNILSAYETMLLWLDPNEPRYSIDNFKILVKNLFPILVEFGWVTTPQIEHIRMIMKSL